MYIIPCFLTPYLTRVPEMMACFPPNHPFSVFSDQSAVGTGCSPLVPARLATYRTFIQASQVTSAVLSPRSVSSFTRRLCERWLFSDTPLVVCTHNPMGTAPPGCVRTFDMVWCSLTQEPSSNLIP